MPSAEIKYKTNLKESFQLNLLNKYAKLINAIELHFLLAKKQIKKISWLIIYSKTLIGFSAIPFLVVIYGAMLYAIPFFLGIKFPLGAIISFGLIYYFFRYELSRWIWETRTGK